MSIIAGCFVNCHLAVSKEISERPMPERVVAGWHRCLENSYQQGFFVRNQLTKLPS